MKQTILPIVAAAAALSLAACGGGDSSEGGASGGSAGPADGVTIDIELPDELAVGTPKDIKVLQQKASNLDTNKEPQPIKVPEGAKVISKGKTVTSSDKEEPFEGTLDMITDGDKDGNEGYSVILGEGPQWVQVDLGEPMLVDAVVLWHYFKNDRVVLDVVVQLSNDPEFKEGVTTIFNNDHDASSGMEKGSDAAYIGTYHGKQIPAGGTKAQYVRCWSNGSTDNPMNEYIEVEVWGRPAN